MEWLIAGIIATVAAFGGAVDTWIDYKNTQDELEKTEEDLLVQYKDRKKQLEDKYDVEKQEANKQADKMDKAAEITDIGLNTEERALSDDFNQGVGQLQMQQEDNLWTWNNAMASIGANEGNELAGIANSGVRAGSSLAQAVELEASTNNAALERQIDATNKQQKWTLANLFTNQMRGQNNIWQARVGADQQRLDATDLRASYEEGGGQWLLQQDSLNSLWDDYQIARDKNERAWQRNKDSIGWKMAASILGNGNSGFQTGYNLWNTFTEGSSYKG